MHPFAPPDFFPPTEDFGKSIARYYENEERKTCFACDSNFYSFGLFSRVKTFCPLCGGAFCKKCLKNTVKLAKLFDSPQNCCSLCYNRLRNPEAHAKTTKELTNRATQSQILKDKSKVEDNTLPPNDKINDALERFMDETNVPEESKGVLRQFPQKKKWDLISSYQVQQNISKSVDAPATHVEKMSAPTKENAISLKVSLANASLSWLEDFISLEGPKKLMEQYSTLLNKPTKTEEEIEILQNYVYCWFGIGNVRVGLQYLLEMEQFVETMGNSALYFEGTIRNKILEMLAGMCLVSEVAHRHMMKTIDMVLPQLLDILIVTSSPVSEKEPILTLINALINRLEDTESSQLRKEYALDLIVSLLGYRPTCRAGLYKIIQTYKALTGDELNKQIYSVNAEENRVMHRCKLLTKQLVETPAILTKLGELFDEFTMLPREGKAALNSWDFIGNVAQCATDVGPLENEGILCRKMVKRIGEVYDMSFIQDATVPEAHSPWTKVEKKEGERKGALLTGSSSTGVQETVTGLPGAPTEQAPGIPLTATPAGDTTTIPGPPSGIPPPPGMGGIPGPPPPPGMGGIPGPPGMPGSGPSAIPRKPQIQPNIKMRRFNWNKINFRSAKGTFWEDLDESQCDIQVQNLEVFFGLPESKKKNTVKEVASTTIHLLEMRRSQNLSIVLSRYSKISLSQLVDAVKNLDETLISAENAIGLCNSCPTVEEMKEVKAFKGDISTLDKPEQYILLVAEVPRYKERLESLVTKHTFHQKQVDSHKRLVLMKSTLSAFRESQSFQKMLTVILAVGNYLNSNSIAGGAFGFRLSSLTKMADCRSPVQSKISLLHFMTKLFNEGYKEILELPDSFETLKEAARLDINPVVSEVRELSVGINTLKKEMKSAEECGDTAFLTSFQDFFDYASDTLQATLDLAKSLSEEFENFVGFFAEDSKLTYKELMCNFENFFNQFRRALDENILFEIQEKKKQQLSTKMASTSTGILDSALDNLRAGAVEEA